MQGRTSTGRRRGRRRGLRRPWLCWGRRREGRGRRGEEGRRLGHEIGLGLITSNTFPRFLSFFGRGASQGTNPKEERADRVLDAAPLRKKAGIAFGPCYRACEGPLSGPGRFDVEQKLASVSRADDRLSREQRGRLCEVEVGAFIHLLSLALLADPALFDPNNNIPRNANTCYPSNSRFFTCSTPSATKSSSNGASCRSPTSTLQTPIREP